MIVYSHPAQKAARTTRNAFTLLEVLVVVAIIVVLAGIGGYYLLPQLDAAKVKAAQADCVGLAGQADIYRLNNSDHGPLTSIQQLTQQQPNGGDPLVPVDKIKDPWGKPYQLDATGPKTRVYTTTPRGITVSNIKLN